jgi:hypothetical protein
MKNSQPSFPIVQVAYFVTDIREAALQMTNTFGAGPFHILDNIQLAWGEHRGERCDFVHSSAYGQWGKVMMELVQQESPGPSPFRDLYAPGESGLHHVATMVDSLPDAYAEFAEAGYPVATRAETLTGTEFAFLDATHSLGHFIEVYERSEALLGFYDFVHKASVDWDGSEPVREL